MFKKPAEDASRAYVSDDELKAIGNSDKLQMRRIAASMALS